MIRYKVVTLYLLYLLPTYQVYINLEVRAWKPII